MLLSTATTAQGFIKFVLVKNVPVNYAIRFSGPVTALTARRVRYGVGPNLICQPGPSPGIPCLTDTEVFVTFLFGTLPSNFI
jgi:hypothetical protein